MSNKPRIKFDPNISHEIKLMGSMPFKSGTNTFDGQEVPWHGWSVSEDGEDKTIFATDFLNDLIMRYEKGDMIEISKTVVDGKNGWEIIPINDSAIKRYSNESSGNGETIALSPSSYLVDGEIKTIPTSQEQPDQKYWENKEDLKQFNIKDALAGKFALKSFELFPTQKKKFSPELLTEWAKRKDQFLVEMLSTYESAKRTLESCESIPQLENTILKYKYVWKRLCTEEEYSQLEVIGNGVKQSLNGEQPVVKEPLESDDVPF